MISRSPVANLCLKFTHSPPDLALCETVFNLTLLSHYVIVIYVTLSHAFISFFTITIHQFSITTPLPSPSHALPTSGAPPQRSMSSISAVQLLRAWYASLQLFRGEWMGVVKD